MEVSKVTRRARVLDESRGDLMNRDFKGVWIPREIWLNTELSITEKVLLVEIDSLDNEEGCFASNEYLAKFIGISKDRVSKLISGLSKKGYLTTRIIYKNDSKQIEKRILNTTIGYRRKQLGGIGKNNYTPIGENNEDNNTLFNNTNYIHDDDNARVRENDIYHFYQQNFGVLTPIIGQKISDWINVLNFELVKEALIRTLMNNTRSFNYAEAIMRDWKDKNIREIEQVHALDLERQSKKGSRTTQKPNQKKQDTSFSESIGLKVW